MLITLSTSGLTTESDQLPETTGAFYAISVMNLVGDSVLVLEAGVLLPDVLPWTNSVYVYLPDVDSAFEKAMELGATAVAKPAEKPYQERQAGFRDLAGNTWWISTYQGS